MRPSNFLQACIAAASAAFSLQLCASTPVYLDGPKVAKLDWNTRSLISADFNNDGRTDLGVINNDSGKVELLLQRDPDAKTPPAARKTLSRNRWEPVLEDSPFERQSVLMGLFGYALAAGDLNGDGLTDIVYTGNLTPLTIRYQDKDGGWDSTWTYDNVEPEQWVSTLAVADIDGDGRMDLGVLARNELLLFFQGKDGKMQEPSRFRLAQADAHQLTFTDLNGDGLRDVVWLSGDNQYRRVSIRLQESPGQFGPELAFPMRTGAIGLAELTTGKQPLFATIEGKTRLVQTFVLKPGKDVPKSLDDVQVRDYALGTKVGGAGLYAWGDFNGDGRTDMAVADPSGARVLLFLQTGQGDFGEGVFFPSFSNISSIATVHTAGGADSLVVSSSKEDVVGISHYTKKGRLTFPDLIKVDGDPQAVTAGDYEGDGTSEIAIVYKKDRETSLGVLQSGAGGWTMARTQKLDDIKRDPEGLVTLHLDGDGRDDLLLLTPREPTRLLLSKPDQFEEVAKDSAIRRTSLNGTDRGRMGIEDVDGDGRDEILVGDTGYVRALSLDDKGELKVVDQFNSRSPQAIVRGPFMADIERKGSPQLLLYDDNADRLELLERDDEGVFRSAEVLDVGQFDMLGARRVAMTTKGGNPALLFLGQERFWVVPLDRPGWVREQVRAAYETDLEDVNYTDIASGDFNDDGSPDLLMIDGRQNLMDILTWETEPTPEWTSALHFVVFDANMHFQGRSSGTQEPREEAVGDFNNDHRDDIAILVHDRVLLYTQQSAAQLAAAEAAAKEAQPREPDAPAAKKE